MFLWNGDSGLGIGDSEDRVRACFGSRGEATAAVAVAFRQSRIPNPQSRLFVLLQHRQEGLLRDLHAADLLHPLLAFLRSDEHTSELQSLMRISYAVFCLKTQNHYK